MTWATYVQLIDFCKKEDKLYLIDEWDVEKNFPDTSGNIRHGSSLKVWWKCKKVIRGKRN